MQLDDLPLFNWKPPVRVIVFPLVRRVGKVRHTASKLVGKQGDDATLYWKQVVASNRKHLERIGLDDAAIENQLGSFFGAVQAELTRLTYRGRRPGGDAA